LYEKCQVEFLLLSALVQSFNSPFDYFSLAERFLVRTVPAQVSDPEIVSGTLKAPPNLQLPNETHEHLKSFHECNLFICEKPSMKGSTFRAPIRGQQHQ
jgi:hypothetical protein